jgi:ketosteroid isomerase-like protein
MNKVIAIALLGCASLASTSSAGSGKTVGEPSFAAFLPQWETAQSRFINGDPTLWKENASHADDASIFGAFGGHESGWAQVGPRNDWASGQFEESGAKQNIEYFNKVATGDLAFTISIERQVAQIKGQTAPTPRALRVTQIFRKEGDKWKLLHRHADPLVERLPPAERR